MNYPKIGVGVLIQKNNDFLLGRRINHHGVNTWSPPGGFLEYGENFEDCAIREVKEETGLIIKDPIYMGITNNIFLNENMHTVSILFKCVFPDQQNLINKEPDKIAEWKWFNIKKFPKNIFLPLKNLLEKNPKMNSHLNISF